MATSAHDPAALAYFEFIEEFRRESDRAAVVLGAAKLDLLLYQLFQAVLLPCAASKDELLDSDGPLGAFSAKINLAHRLDLIDGPFARALHLVRKIRNSFAHETSSNSLNAGSHRDRVRELLGPFRNNQHFAQFQKSFFEGVSGPSIDFRSVLAVMAARLEAASEDMRPIGHRESWTLVPPTYELQAAADGADQHAAGATPLALPASLPKADAAPPAA